jgi:hypothetical protein
MMTFLPENIEQVNGKVADSEPNYDSDEHLGCFLPGF